ncbi:MAG: hypothetical protein JNL83_34060 [Myxococcales bacterium]|nr:hypothetical protein [Myxococcales bacterium]
MELTPVPAGEAVVRCSERRPDGKPVGELEVSMFKAALIIDRDGILEEKARTVAETCAAASSEVAGTVAISLPGASGYRADVEPRRNSAGLPYVHVFAMAPHDLGIDGGVVVVVRSAAPEWPAAEQMLGSLRLLTRNGAPQPANDEEHPPLLPIVSRE